MFLKGWSKLRTLNQISNCASLRMASTVTGKSGRVYVQGEILQRNTEEKLSIFKAVSDNETFVTKRVSQSFYALSQALANQFRGSHRLRMHIDHNQETITLIYLYFTTTLLSLIERDPDFPVLERKKILRSVGEAIQELHHKNWIHIDVKPDNILVNCSYDEGKKTVTHAVLGDFDIAFKLEHDEPLRTHHAVGNAMWRSPEGQTGKGVTKASDIFSFGLVCLYALGGGELLLLKDYQKMVKHGIVAEQETLVRHFSYFGLVSDGLLERVNNDVWAQALIEASETAKRAIQQQPELRFEYWGSDLGPDAQDLISGMTNTDPTARLTIDQVLMHRWWNMND